MNFKDNEYDWNEMFFLKLAICADWIRIIKNKSWKYSNYALKIIIKFNRIYAKYKKIFGLFKRKQEEFAKIMELN